MRFKKISLVIAIAFSCTLALRAEAPRWLKGNIHTHSFWSDGNQFPEMIAQWYVDRDYQFLALSDHNILSKGEKWMPYATLTKRGGEDVVAKYIAAFGKDWVVTRGESGTANYAIRLKTLEEFRGKVESADRFLMIQSEEISDRSQGGPVHMNATNIQELIPPVGGATVREAMTNNLRAVAEQAKRTGKPIILHLNHPNFGYAVTAEDIASVVMERYVEIYNGHPGVNVAGDDEHASIEEIWDIANTIRLVQLGAAPLFGVGTDDSHHYHGRGSSRPGRSWIMVRCDDLNADAVTKKIQEGDFYSSSGVTLRDVQFDAKKRSLVITIKPQAGITYKTQFIGTLKSVDLAAKPRLDKNGKPRRTTHIYSKDIGKVLGESMGVDATYQFTGDELYVRAVVTSSKAHSDPTLPNQTEQAWTQPVGWNH